MIARRCLMLCVVCAFVATTAATDDAPVADAPEDALDDTPEDTPDTDAPVTDAPVTDAPVTDAPVTDAPVIDAPVTDAPAPEEGAPEDAETNAPEDAPETNAPQTSAPQTNAPQTNAPQTNAPQTNAPETNIPVPTEPRNCTKVNGECTISCFRIIQDPCGQSYEEKCTDGACPSTSFALTFGADAWVADLSDFDPSAFLQKLLAAMRALTPGIEAIKPLRVCKIPNHRVAAGVTIADRTSNKCRSLDTTSRAFALLQNEECAPDGSDCGIVMEVEVAGNVAPSVLGNALETAVTSDPSLGVAAVATADPTSTMVPTQAPSTPVPPTPNPPSPPTTPMPPQAPTTPMPDISAPAESAAMYAPSLMLVFTIFAVFLVS